MPPPGEWGGRAAQAWVASVLRTYGDTCHLCHHGQADSGDHLRPRLTHPHLALVVSNGRPVHHKPCPVCLVRCNIVRKAKPLTAADSVDALGFFDAGCG